MKLAQSMSRLGTESAFEILARAKRLQAEGKDIINLGIGSPDFQTPQNIVEAGVKALRDGRHFYTPAKGIPELREAVAADCLRHRRVEIDPECVVIVPGGKPTMAFAIQMFGEPGGEILYPNPGFPIYESMINFTGAKAVPMELLEANGFEFDPEAVLAKVNDRTRMIIVNTPANPTGGVVSRAALDRLVQGLEAWPEVVIFADEIYSRLVYGRAEHVSLLEYESIRDRLIVLDGWSKTFSMTGWRLGWGLWPKSLVDQAERLQINSTSCAPAPVQWAGVEALNGPQGAVDEMVREFDRRRVAIVKGLNEIPGFSCVTPLGAFYAFPNITGTGMSSRELQDHLLGEAGVATVGGTAFGALGEGYIRFSYASSMDQIQAALRRTADSLSTV